MTLRNNEKYDNLQFRYNTSLTTQIKDFLPIISNEIPNKFITYFDDTDAALISHAGDGALSFDYIKSYLGESCSKLNLAAAENGSITFTPDDAIDLTSLSSKNNGYSNTEQSLLLGNDEDNGAFVLNMQTDANCFYSIFLYSGTKAAILDYVEIDDSANMLYNAWNKIQLRLNDTDFIYNNGFTDADFSNITSIKIDIVAGAAETNFYLQSAFCALPKYSADITSAYYPDVNETNSIYVSWLFGDDANDGEDRANPVKTIDAAISLITATRLNLVILDSETYKPITDNTTSGIAQTITEDINIIADYLETPKLSNEAGLLNEDRIGARQKYRTAEPDITGGGNYLTVGSGGTYATIALAYAASSDLDVIQIVDSATYDETITTTKNISFVAAAGQTPTWKNSAGVSTLILGSGYTSYIHGIIFEGNGSGAEKRITTGAAPDDIYIKDCTFKNIGSSTSGSAIDIAHNASNFNVENCLFIDNGAKFKAVNITSNIAGNITFINNKCFMQSNSDNYIIAAAKSANAAINVYANYNYAIGDANYDSFYFFYCADAAATVYPTNAYIFLNNIIYGSISYSYINSLKESDIYISNNNMKAAIGESPIVIQGDAASSGAILVIEDNFIDAEIGTGNIYFINLNIGSTIAVSFNRNIIIGDNLTSSFIGILAGDKGSGNFLTPDITSFANNIISGFETGFYYVSNSVAVNISVSNNIMLNMTTFDYDSIRYGFLTKSTFTSDKDLSYNVVKNSAIVTYTNNVTDAPEFIDYDNNNFAWYFNGALETYQYWINNYSKLINPTVTAAETLTLKFIELSGSINSILLSSVDVDVTATYCKFNNAVIGIQETGANINSYNNYFTNNGIAARLNNATVIDTATYKNNIMYLNNTGFILASAADIQYNTVINNDYGVTAVFTGFYALESYISDYMTIQNNIFYDNSVYDFYYNKIINYCIYGTSYYAVSGTGNTNSAARLTDNYFPATKYEGYALVSPAYLADSSGSGNIGARNENNIKAVLNYASYTVNGNPQHKRENLTPVNLEENINVNGDYDSYSDADIKQFTYDWDEAGRYSKIDADQKTAMENIYKSYWVIGISEDGGATWEYYKVVKSAALSMEQFKYYFSDMPHGSASMLFTELPSFDITDYEIDTF